MHPRIKAITVRAGSVVDGISISYPGKTFSNGGTGGKAHTIELERGEWVTDVTVRATDDGIQALTFKTNKGQTLSAGGGGASSAGRGRNSRARPPKGGSSAALRGANPSPWMPSPSDGDLSRRISKIGGDLNLNFYELVLTMYLIRAHPQCPTIINILLGFGVRDVRIAVCFLIFDRRCTTVQYFQFSSRSNPKRLALSPFVERGALLPANLHY